MGAFAVDAMAQPVSNQPLAFNPATVGSPDSNRAGEFFPVSSAAGRVPAVVILHGCSGISAHTRRWARRMNDWGYAALVVDSFRPRGENSVCDRPGVVPLDLRARDAFAAAAYLRTLRDMDPERIAVVGFSHGGSSALITSNRSAVQRAGAPPFSAVVSFYPWCPRQGAPVASDVLILIGDADDWTPAERCVALHRSWQREYGSMQLVVYPGATHAFDALGRPRLSFGHQITPDEQVTLAAVARTRQFLAEHLGR